MSDVRDEMIDCCRNFSLSLIMPALYRVAAARS